MPVLFLLINIIKRFLISLVVVFTASIVSFQPALANDSQTMFTKYMLEWREKSEVAQDYLRKGEQELKAGQKYRACVNQRLASQFGVEAFEALIKAQQYNDSDKELINIEENLDKWRKLSRCNTANSLFY